MLIARILKDTTLNVEEIKNTTNRT